METPSLTFEPEPKIRTFGGWYQHTRVLRAGREIGRIQVRVRPGSKGRADVLTSRGNACVLGRAVDWLVRMDDAGETFAGA
jgi:hypothetical protein